MESLIITQLDQCATQTSLLYPETLITSFVFLHRVHPITVNGEMDKLRREIRRVDEKVRYAEKKREKARRDEAERIAKKEEQERERERMRDEYWD